MSDSHSAYAENIASIIEEIILKARAISSRPTVFLTGGRTARRLYRHFGRYHPRIFEGCSLLLGDERCVPTNHKDSWPNVRDCVDELVSLNGGSEDPILEADQYQRKFPSVVDLLLLSVGNDGHVASIFRGSPAANEYNEEFMFVSMDQAEHDRMTVTPKLVLRANNLILLATGRAKGRVLADALRDDTTTCEYPVLLASRGCWILDHAAAAEFKMQHSIDLKCSNRVTRFPSLRIFENSKSCPLNF